MTKIAVVGAGLIGRKHIDVVRKYAVLDAIVDPSPAAEALAASLGVSWFAEVEDYLVTGRPDGAIVATPNRLHWPHGGRFIATGIPVLVEKPLAESTSSAEKLVSLSRKANVPVLVGHHRRHSPLVKAAKAAIDAGDLGRLATVNAQFWLYKPQDYFDVEWRRKDGAGPTFINLIHDIDLLRHFCGDIVSVQAMESRAIRSFEVEDTCAAVLEFENGALGTVTISDTVVAPWSWELTAGENPAYPKTDMACYMFGGTRGSLSIPDLRHWKNPGKQSWWEPIEATNLTFEAADPVEEQFKHFLDVIRNDATPLVSAQEGMKNLQVLEALKNATLHGATQSVGEPSPIGLLQAVDAVLDTSGPLSTEAETGAKADRVS
ncbi:MAG: Gfo/Idh/MocA family oxidoreductase [Stappiaceae bacterium]